MSLVLTMNNSFPFHRMDRMDHMDVDSDGESDTFTDISRSRRSDTTSRTSVDGSMRSASPAPSVRSMTTSEQEAVIAEVHGRGVNTYSTVYALPADRKELDRLGAFSGCKLLRLYSIYCGRASTPDVEKDSRQIS